MQLGVTMTMTHVWGRNAPVKWWFGSFLHGQRQLDSQTKTKATHSIRWVKLSLRTCWTMEVVRQNSPLSRINQPVIRSRLQGGDFASDHIVADRPVRHSMMRLAEPCLINEVVATSMNLW